MGLVLVYPHFLPTTVFAGALAVRPWSHVQAHARHLAASDVAAGLLAIAAVSTAKALACLPAALEGTDSLLRAGAGFEPRYIFRPKSRWSGGHDDLGVPGAARRQCPGRLRPLSWKTSLASKHGCALSLSGALAVVAGDGSGTAAGCHQRGRLWCRNPASVLSLWAGFGS